MVRDSALRNRVLVRFSTAYFLATVAEWIFCVGGLVYAFDKGGARTTGFASLALLLPTALAAPASGAAPRRHNPHVVMLAAYSAETIAFCRCSGRCIPRRTSGSRHRPVRDGGGRVHLSGPASAVSLPAVVRSTRELTTANLWIGSCDGTSTLVGSLLATILLAAEGPALALAGGAVLTAIAVAFMLPHSRNDAITAVCDTDTDTEVDSAGATRLIFRSVIELASDRGSAASLRWPADSSSSWVHSI